MANVDFSWTDSFQAAVSCCLPCLQSSPSDADDGEDHPHHPHPPRPRHPAFAHAIPPPRARPDELEGLLADASDDADALSLHTNPGERRTRVQAQRRRHPTPKHIRIFGYDLFGRGPAIQLPESDEEDAAPRPVDRTRSVSSSTLDEDAAPLDVEAIGEMSAARHAAALVREEEMRREKEERRRRRRERKEIKRAAMARALELQADVEQDFEGFQGSGPAFGAPAPFSPSVDSGTGTGSGSITSSQQQEFGPFAQGQHVEPFDPDVADAAEADADFGGESYTSRPRAHSSRAAHAGGTRSTDDTRSSSSRGTHSLSQGSQGYAHVPPSGLPRAPLSPLAHETVPASSFPNVNVNVTERKKRRKSRAHKALSVSTSSRSAGTSASASELTSPPPSARTPRIAVGVGAQEDFEGFLGEFGVVELVRAGVGAGAGAGKGEGEGAGKGEGERGEEGEGMGEEGGYGWAARKGGYLPVAGFPSAGIRRSDSRGTNGDVGVFLAHRGDRA